MDEPVNMRHFRLSLVLLGSLLCVGTASQGQTLPDPTRPPASVILQGDHPETVNVPVLQSVLISPTRKLAIISGKQVMVGELFGTARVIRISDNEVVLQDGKDKQTLKLFSLKGIGMSPTSSNRSDRSAQ